jgi:archaellin
MRANMKHILILIIALILMAVVVGCTTTNNVSPVTTPTPEIVYVTVTVPITVQVSEKTTETTPISINTGTIRLIDNVYGISSHRAAGIDEFKFSIGLSRGNPTLDLTRLKIVFSTPTSQPSILSQGGTASTTEFTTRLNSVIAGSGRSYTPTEYVRYMDPGDQVEINFKVAPVPANTNMMIELHPDVGTTTSFSMTAPETISVINIF